jgi:hypothetical protein
MDYMDGAPVKVFASVSLNTIKMEPAVLDSVAILSKSSERLCVVLEESAAKYERPLNILILSIAFGIVLTSGAFFLQSLEKYQKKKQ